MCCETWRFESSREHPSLPTQVGRPRAFSLYMQNPEFVHAAFAQISERYVVTNHVLSLGTDILWRRKVARLVRDLQPPRILDLATGSGDLAMEMAKQCPQAKILGADFCDPMLDVARAREIPGLELMVADALDLPFADASYEVVTVAFGLRNMASWPKAVQEMARVLTPGGHLVILDFSLPTLPVLRPLYRWYLHRLLPKIAGLITGQKAAFEYLSNSIEAFPSGQEMLALLQANGLQNARCIPLNFGIASIYIAERITP